MISISGGALSVTESVARRAQTWRNNNGERFTTMDSLTRPSFCNRFGSRFSSVQKLYNLPYLCGNGICLLSTSREPDPPCHRHSSCERLSSISSVTAMQAFVRCTACPSLGVDNLRDQTNDITTQTNEVGCGRGIRGKGATSREPRTC